MSTDIPATRQPAEHQSTSTVEYEVQEFLPVGEKWIRGYGGFETPEDARAMRKRWEETFTADRRFRVAKIVTTVEVTVLD